MKITRPTNVELWNIIKSELKGIENIKVEIDYKDLGFKKILCIDAKRFDIGVIILSL